jgi:hypothetical protein
MRAGGQAEIDAWLGAMQRRRQFHRRAATEYPAQIAPRLRELHLRCMRYWKKRIWAVIRAHSSA